MIESRVIPINLLRKKKELFLFVTLGIPLVHAFLVIVGWLIPKPELTQISPTAVPMQFNTALCFVASVLAIYAVFRERYIWARLIIVAVVSLASLTLLQSLLSLDFGLDELFVRHNVTVNTSHPGRMAPNTSMGFIALGISLHFLASKAPLSRYLLVSYLFLLLVLVTSLLAVLGYLLGLAAGYAWAELTHMALQTAIAFILLCASVVVLAGLKGRGRLPRYAAAYFVGALMFGITVGFSLITHSYLKNELDKEIATVLDNVITKGNEYWEAELTKLLIHYARQSQVSERVELNRLPDLFLDVYIDHGERNSNLKDSPGFANQDFLRERSNPYFEALDVQFTRIFNYFERSVFALQVALPNLKDKSDEPVKSILVLVDHQQRLALYAGLLPEGILLHLEPNVRQRAQAVSFDLPLMAPEQKPQVTINAAFTRQHDHSLSTLVFLSGLIITLSMAMAVVYAQRSRYKTEVIASDNQIKTQMQSELNRAVHIQRMVTEITGLGIFQWDLQTNKLEWDQEMFQIYEPSEELLKNGLYFETWYLSLHPEDRETTLADLQRALDADEVWHAEFRIKLSGERVKYIRAAAQALYEGGGTRIVVGSNVDITKEHELATSLKDKTRQAEQHSKAKSYFLANMSHEIRTPMNAILGLGDLLESSDLDANQANYLQRMMRSAQHLMELINDILDLSKIEAGELLLEKVRVPIEDVVVDAVRSLAVLAHEKGLNFNFYLSQEVPAFVQTDPTRLSQIVVNLVSNAIKFTETGSVLVNIGLQEKNGDEYQVFIEVLDTGIGIEAEKLEQIFQPFSQADVTTTRKYGGTGLGLTIVSNLVQLMGGTIKVESYVGDGTRIKLVLPMLAGEQILKPGIIEDEDDSYTRFSHKNTLSNINCLVVEDSEQNQLWLKDMLHSWRCNVTVSSEGRDAFDLIRKHQTEQNIFDVIIIAMALPDMSATDFVPMVREYIAKQGAATHLPKFVVMIQSNNLKNDIDKLTNLGIEQYLIKPVKQSEVFNAIVDVLGRQSSRKIEQKKIRQLEKQASLKVLVAEDNPVNQYLIQNLLEKRGHHVMLVDNGRLACEMLEQEDFDAVLMDVQMPVMDGIEATKRIRATSRQKDIYIVGLTARALKEDAALCVQAGMNHYLTKPIDPQMVFSALESERIKHTQQFEEGNVHGAEVDAVVGGKIVDSDGKEFDLERAMQSTSQDEALVVKLLRLTENKLPELLLELSEHLAAGETEQIAEKLHKLKGMLANFCRSELTEFMERIIQDVNYGHAAVIHADCDRLFKRIARFQEGMDDYLKSTMRGE